ncbi:MAG: recombinase family protein [Pirellulales bacterium]
MKLQSQKTLSSRRSPHHDDEVEHRPTRDTRPGNPRKYIAHLKRIMREASGTLPLVLYARVSRGHQRRNGNIQPQLADVRRRAEKLAKHYGVTVDIIGEFDEEVSGWKLWKSKRPELLKAAKLAGDKNAVLVALNTSRFVRNNYSYRNGTLPTVADFERLITLVGNVRLATILPPDQHEDRSSDTIRGHKAKAAKPGRPPKKKRRRKRLKLRVIRLIKQGLNNCEICRALDMPVRQESNVRRWRERYRKYWGRHFLLQNSEN